MRTAAFYPIDCTMLRTGRGLILCLGSCGRVPVVFLVSIVSKNPPHRSAEAGNSDLGAMAPVSKLLHSGLKHGKDMLPVVRDGTARCCKPGSHW